MGLGYLAHVCHRNSRKTPTLVDLKRETNGRSIYIGGLIAAGIMAFMVLKVKRGRADRVETRRREDKIEGERIKEERSKA